MLDINLLRKFPYKTAEKLLSKNFIFNVNNFIQYEIKRKKLQKEIETLQIEQNKLQKKFNNLKNQSSSDQEYIYIIKIKNNLKTKKNELKIIHQNIQELILSIPNIPDISVPYGKNIHNNKEIYFWKKPRKYTFPIKDHVHLGESLKYLDFMSAVKLTSNRFVVIKGQLAKLHRALIQFMLNFHIENHGYNEYYIPYIVNKSSLYGSGQLPKFQNDLFFTYFIHNKNKDDNFALIPTAEVPLINLFKNTILEENNLPIKMVAHSPCFRSEVGSYGKDTRGLLRMHQFDKIEIIQIVKPEESMTSLEIITHHAEKILQLLNLPYKKILLCTGETNFTSCKTYDLEVWFPSQHTYREISSCSNTGDFQSRRTKTRFREKNTKKIQFVHIINGSGIAIDRTLAAIIENYQLSDGRIKIPMILRPYMKNQDYIE